MSRLSGVIKPMTWVDTLTTLYSDFGINTFAFWPSGDRERQSRIFAEEVVPAVREALASD
jgi:hypothetical protein